jgi:hypothetical protein
MTTCFGHARPSSGHKLCYSTHRHTCYTHTPPTLPSTSNPHKDRTTYKIRNKEYINHVNVTYTTSNLRTSQNPPVSPKPKIYINTPTPHARPPEARHAKARLSKASQTEGKALSSPNLPQDTPPVASTHHHRGTTERCIVVFAYIGPNL